MGRRRVLTAVLALVLALTGTVLLTRYVRGADERALAGTTTTQVLVVTSPISQGTPVEALADRLETKSLPAMAVAPGALSSLGEAGGRVAAVDLQPGEQLLATRLVDPATLKKSDEVVVPAGLQEVSVALAPERMLQSGLAPGDRVGVMISLTKDDARPASTALALQQVLVTKIDQSPAVSAARKAAAEDGTVTDGNATLVSSTDAVLVTLAVNAVGAQKIVFGAEHGSLWLTRQPAGTPTTAPPVLTRKDVDR